MNFKSRAGSLASSQKSGGCQTNNYSTVRPLHLTMMIFVLSVTLPFWGYGQTDTTSNKYYFDDGGVAASRSIIKVETLSIIHGEVPLTLEVFVKKNFSVEGGAGLILPYYVHDFLALLVNGQPTFTNSSFGYGLWLSSKLYLREAPESRYWMLQLRQRNFTSTTVSEFTFSMGKQKIIGKRFTMDYGIGLGLRFQKYSKDAYLFDPDFSFVPIVPIYLKFGRLL